MNSAVLISLWIFLKFSIFVYLHVLPLISCEFHENFCSENWYNLCKGINEILLIFLDFSTDLDTSSYWICPKQAYID